MPIVQGTARHSTCDPVLARHSTAARQSAKSLMGPVTSTVHCVQEIDVSPFVPFSDADVTRQAALRWSSLLCQNAAAPGKKPTFPYAGRRCCWRQSCLSACDQTTCHAAAGSRLRDTTLLSLAAQDAMAQRHDEDMRT